MEEPLKEQWFCRLCGHGAPGSNGTPTGAPTCPHCRVVMIKAPVAPLSSKQRLKEIRARAEEHKQAVEFGSTIFDQADLDRAALLEMIDSSAVETTDMPRLEAQLRMVCHQRDEYAALLREARRELRTPGLVDRIERSVDYSQEEPEALPSYKDMKGILRDYMAPTVKRCCCGEWELPHDWISLETATSVHRRDHACHQREPENGGEKHGT